MPITITLGRSEDMKNVKNVDAYGHHSPFPTRFRALLDGEIATPAKRQSITQKEFSKAVLHCARQTVGRYADGTTPPNILDLQAIAEYYQVSCDWLLGIDTCITKDIEEISSEYGLNENTLLKLKELAYNPFAEKGRYVEGSIPEIELVNNLFKENIADGVLNAISEYLSADTLYTIDSYDLQNVSDNDEAFKLKEKVKEVDKTLLDNSLLFNIQVKLKQLKEKIHPINNYK